MRDEPTKRWEGSGPAVAGRVMEWWALAGGLLLLGVALMTTWSAASGFFVGRPLPGDVELTEMLVAVAVFAFLPYCQVTDANVTADFFTARARRLTVAAFSAFGALIALAFSALFLWRTYAGFLDYRQYVETTAILKIPIWWAYVPALVSLVLLVLGCLMVLVANVRAILRG